MSRVVAITGASAGIGRALALRLARDGARLAICARRRDRLDDTANDIVERGGQPFVVQADVARDDEVRQFVARAAERWGHLDAVVCNAGFGLYGTIDAVGSDRVRTLMDVNFFGTYNAAAAALAVFKQQGRGHIVIISSIVGQRGIPFMGPYCATKFAQVGLAECLRAEVVGTGIHVSVVYPISTETEFQSVMKHESGFATRASGPKQSAEQVAEAIAKTLDRPAPEVYPQRISKGLAVLNAVAPGFTDRLVRRWGRKPIE